MDSSRWQRIVDLFDRAEAVPADEQAGFLERECGGDDALRDEVLRMLRAASTSFLESPDQSAPHGPAPGSTLDDFALGRVLGVGGMATVYLARQRSLDREVALKVVTGGPGIGREMLAKFELESRRLARTEHPNIVPVHAFGRGENDAYLAMPYLRGGSLADYIATVRTGGAALDVELACRWVRAIALALDRVHEQRLIHRDVKPANIMLDEDRTPFLTDFGIAKDLETTVSAFGRGTPAYMSPEQATSGGRVDHRTDVYSLGVVLFELLSLERPFQDATGTELLRSIREVDPPRLRSVEPSLPVPLETICSRATRRFPDQRYPTAGALAMDLQLFLSGHPIMARPTTLLERVSAWVARRRVLATSFAAVIAAVLVTAMVSREYSLRSRLSTLEQHASVELQRAREQLGQGDAGAAVEALGEAVRSVDAYADAPRRSSEVEARLRRGTNELATALDRVAQDDLRAFARAASRDPFGLSYAKVVVLATHLARVRTLLPSELKSVASSAVDILGPRVTLLTQPVGAQVYAIRLDPLSLLPGPSSTPMDLGVAPLQSVPMEPGAYHFLAVSEAAGQAELIATVIGVGEEVQLPTLTLRPLNDGAMIEIPGGPLVLHPRERVRASGQAEVQLSNLLVDASEVTNGEYAAFVDATGHPRPVYWPVGADPRQEPWGNLAVVGVSYHDADAFCAWRGKRLLTYYEWSRIARGPTQAETPWGAALLPEDDVRARANVRAESDPVRSIRLSLLDIGKEPDDPGRSALLEALQRGINPRDDQSLDRSVDGVLDLYGNVAEWVAATGVSRLGLRYVPMPSERLFRGASWRTPVQRLEESTAVPPQAINVHVGFRGVKGPPKKLINLADR